MVGKELGVTIKHYNIFSGLREIIEGSCIFGRHRQRYHPAHGRRGKIKSPHQIAAGGGEEVITGRDGVPHVVHDGKSDEKDE